MAYGKIKADTLVYDNSGSDVEVTLASIGNKAGLDSPTFTGTPLAPTASASTSNTQIATTAFVDSSYAKKAASAGTVAASEVVQVDANKDTTGIRNLTISGNLQVNGTTTTVASSTMTVTDKNIELAKGAANDAAADGGGITLESGDGNKTINWVDATNAWTFNQDIEVTTGSVKLTAAEGASAVLELWADQGDDNGDKWRLVSDEASNYFYLQNYASGSFETTIKALGNGSIELYHDNSKKIETTAAGVTVTGSVTDDKGDVRKIPQNHKTSAYVLIASDSGKCITITTGGVTVNTSVFSAGDAVTIINHSGSDQTITQGSSFSLQNAADGTTGNRTLAGRGMATIWFASATEGYISGAGLS